MTEDDALFAKVRQIQLESFRKFQQFSAGMDLYRLEYPIEACANDEQRRGWLCGNKAEAESNMPEFNVYGQVVGC